MPFPDAHACRLGGKCHALCVVAVECLALAQRLLHVLAVGNRPVSDDGPLQGFARSPGMHDEPPLLARRVTGILHAERSLTPIQHGLHAQCHGSRVGVTQGCCGAAHVQIVRPRPAALGQRAIFLGKSQPGSVHRQHHTVHIQYHHVQREGVKRGLIELLTRAQRVVSALAVGNIADGGRDEHSFRGLERTETDLDGKLAAVFALRQQLLPKPHRACLRRCDEAFHVLGVAAAVACRHQHFHPLAKQLLAPISEEPPGLRIGQHDDALAICDDHRVRCRLEQAAEFFLAQPMHRLGACALADVAEEEHTAQDFAILATDR